MRAKRRNIQFELALEPEARGEARSAGDQGTEARTAHAEPERPAAGLGPPMEAVVDPGNLRKALARVRRNKGAPGLDGMTVDDLGDHLKNHWPEIRSRLLDGSYTPQPVRRVEIPKASGGVRPLGVPTVLDRFIQQAAMQVLQGDWDPSFSDASYGFRPGRSAHRAVERAQDHIRAGFDIVVDLDLEKFFDRVNHDILMGLVAKRVADKRLLGLIRGFLTAGVLENGLVGPTTKGMPQGGPLSPLLSNLMLDVLDKELEKRGHRFVRYADDCNIYVRSRRAGERVMASVTRFLARRLKLTVNTAKSAVDRPVARAFLGFSFTAGPAVRRRIAPQALARFKARVRELTRCTKELRGRPISHRGVEHPGYLRRVAGLLARLLQRPARYCDFRLNQWVRRRLRDHRLADHPLRSASIAWTNPLCGATPPRSCRKGLGGEDRSAVPTAHGGSATAQALSYAMPNAFFARLGLASVEYRPVA